MSTRKNRAQNSTPNSVSNSEQLVAICLHSLGLSFFTCKKRKLGFISLQVSLMLNFYDSICNIAYCIYMQYDAIFYFYKVFHICYLTLGGRFSHFHFKDEPTEFLKATDLLTAHKCWLQNWKSSSAMPGLPPGGCAESVTDYSLNEALMVTLHKFFNSGEGVSFSCHLVGHMKAFIF